MATRDEHTEDLTPHEEQAARDDVTQRRPAAPAQQGNGFSDQPTRPADQPERARQPLGLRVLKYTLYAVGGLLGLVLVLVLVVLLLLQTNWGAAKAGDLLIGLANPFDNATLNVGEINGNWISHLELYDVNLTRDDSIRMAHIDALRLRYSLLPLLQKKIHIEEIYLGAPTLSARQAADSTWDLLEFMGPDTTAADTASSAFTFLVDQIVVETFDATAAFYAPGRDSTLHVEDLNVRLHDLVIAEAMALNLDSLWGRFTPPGTPDPVHLAMGAQLSDNLFVLRGLQLSSPNSSMTGRGTLLLPGDTTETVQDVDFTLQAQPLAFRDLHVFAPSLDPSTDLTLDVAVQGSSRLIEGRAEAAFSDGGTVTLTAEATPDQAGPLQYVLQGQVRQLNPGVFTYAGDSTTTGLINADLDVNLRGPSLDQINGTATALLFDTRYGEYVPDRTTLETTFTNGQAQIDLASGLRGARFTLGGTARPFDETPTYDLQGRLRSLDAGRFTTDTTLQSNVNAALRLQGRGFGAETADVTARITFAPSTINRYQLNDGFLEARVANGNLDLDARLLFPEGEIAARGQAQLGDEVRYQVSQGRLTNVDVAALAGDTTHSRLNGLFTLNGEGTAPDSMRLQADLRLTDTFYGPYTVDADLHTELRDGRLEARASADLGAGGAFDLAATARPFDPVITYAVTRGTFNHVDVGALTQNPDQQSDLNGTLTLRGRGTEPAAMTLEGRLDLSASRLNNQPIREASFATDLQRGTLTFDARLALPEGQTVLAGTATPFAARPAYALREGTFNGLNIGALLGNPGLETDLNGTLTLEGEGFEPRAMTMQTHLQLSRSAVNDALLSDGYLDAAVENEEARLETDLAFDTGRARLNASGRLFDENPTYEAHADVQNADLGRLMGNDTLAARLNLRLDVAGTGLEPATMTTTGQLDAGGTSYADVQINRAQTTFRMEGGLLQLDTLLVSSNVATATGGGQVALFDTLATAASDFRLQVNLTNLAPVAPLVGADMLTVQDGLLTLTMTGRPGTLRYEAKAEAGSVIYNDIRVAGFDLTSRGELGRDRSLDVAMVRATLDYFSVPSLTVRETHFEAEYENEEVTFLGELDVDERRDAQLRGRVDLRPDNQRLLLEDLTLRFDQDQWRLLEPASIYYGDSYRVRNLLLYTGNQQIAVDGMVDFDGEQNLVVTIEQFRIGAIADLLNFQGLGGTLNGTLDLTGPAASPRVNSTLNFDVESYDDRVGTLRMNLAYADLKMALDAVLTHVDQSTLSIEGSLPMDLSLSSGDAGQEKAPPSGNLDFTIEADSFAIGWVRPFLDPATVDRLDGRLIGQLQVGGTLDAPVLNGSARLAEGVVGMPEFDVVYRDIRGDLEFNANRVLVNHLEMRSGGGSLIAEGSINLAELTLGEFDINVSMEDFRAINSAEYQSTLSGDLELSGTTQAPVLEGSLELLSTDINISGASSSSDLAVVKLSERDMNVLEERFGYRVSQQDTTTFSFYEAMTMNLGVDMGRDTWLRQTSNPEMAIQFSGRLDLQKQPNEEINIFGSINVIPARSYIRQFGRRFNITTGEITFNGGPTDFRMDINAQYVVRSRRNAGEPEATINLAVSGTLDDLTFTPSSDPQMEEADILSYIATGRPAGESLQFGGSGGGNGGGGLLTQGAGLAAGQLAGLVEGLAGSELGLDVVEIEQDGLNGTQITAGKYVSPELYLGISQPISFTSSNQTSKSNVGGLATEFTIEYQLYRWLLLNLTSQGSAALRFNLLWEYAY